MVVIQEHSRGHNYGGVGDQGPHFNVREFEYNDSGNRNMTFPGTKEHYGW